MTARRTLPLLVLALLAACSAPPDFERAKRPVEPGPYPTIKPLDQVLAVVGEPALEPADTAALQARAAGLQGRAATLAATQTDPETRARLDAALGTPEP